MKIIDEEEESGGFIFTGFVSVGIHLFFHSFINIEEVLIRKKLYRGLELTSEREYFSWQAVDDRDLSDEMAFFSISPIPKYPVVDGLAIRLECQRTVRRRIRSTNRNS